MSEQQHIYKACTTDPEHSIEIRAESEIAALATACKVLNASAEKVVLRYVKTIKAN